MKPEINSQFDIIYRSLTNAFELAMKRQDSAMLDHLEHIENQVTVLEFRLEEK